MLNDTRGRSCFSETMRSAPFERVDFVHAGTRRSGVLPGGGTFVRSRAWRAPTPADSTTTAAMVSHRVERARLQNGRHRPSPPGSAPSFVTFLLSAGFAASPLFPVGTMLSTTRPAVRYLLATRFTSSAVTD